MQKMSTYEKSKLEAKEGKVTTYSSADELFNSAELCAAQNDARNNVLCYSNLE